MNRTAAIEKNRLALLRVVFGWLLLAVIFRGRGAKPLPRRLASLAIDLLSKAEAAAAFLVLARSTHLSPTQNEFIYQAIKARLARSASLHAPVTVGMLTERLILLRDTLRDLDAAAKKLGTKKSTNCVPIEHELHLLVATISTMDFPHPLPNQYFRQAVPP